MHLALRLDLELPHICEESRGRILAFLEVTKYKPFYLHLCLMCYFSSTLRVPGGRVPQLQVPLHHVRLGNPDRRPPLPLHEHLPLPRAEKTRRGSKGQRQRPEPHRRRKAGAGREDLGGRRGQWGGSAEQGSRRPQRCLILLSCNDIEWLFKQPVAVTHVKCLVSLAFLVVTRPKRTETNIIFYFLLFFCEVICSCDFCGSPLY